MPVARTIFAAILVLATAASPSVGQGTRSRTKTISIPEPPFGFRIEIPEPWQSERFKQFDKSLSITVWDKPGAPSAWLFIDVPLEPREERSAADWVAFHRQSYLKDSPKAKVIREEPIKIGGLPAVVLEIEDVKPAHLNRPKVDKTLRDVTIAVEQGGQLRLIRYGGTVEDMATYDAKISAALGTLQWISPPAAAAKTATKPAPKPDPNTVPVALEEAGVAFRVPKAWKQTKKNATGATFQLPGGGLIVLAGPAKPGAELKRAVDEKKEKILEKSPGTKFSKDQAATLGGNEAWELMYDVQSTAREVDTKTGKEIAGGKTMTLTQRWLDVTCIRDGVFIQLDFVCVEKEFEARSKLARAVMASFEWTVPAPTTKPAEEKK